MPSFNELKYWFKQWIVNWTIALFFFFAEKWFLWLRSLHLIFVKIGKFIFILQKSQGKTTTFWIQLVEKNLCYYYEPGQLFH